MPRLDPREWIAQVKTPSLIVSAFEDEMTPLDRAMELYNLMPNVQMSIISPCGHSPMLEHLMRFAGRSTVSPRRSCRARSSACWRRPMRAAQAAE